MATEKQIAANRRNAALSTGPRSMAGKRKSSMNAMKHGLTGELQLLPDEDPEELRQLCETIEAAWLPVGLRERMLVDRITEAQWMLRRIDKRDAGLAELEVQFRDLSNDRLLEVIKFVSVEGGRDFDRVLKVLQNRDLLKFRPPD